jgi:multiple sugar transport system permease protein
MYDLEEKTLGHRILRVATYTGLILFSIFWLIPAAWILMTSIKPDELIYGSTAILPTKVSLVQYQTAIFETTLPRNFLNSVIVTVATVAVSLLVGSLGAYAASRLDFPGKLPSLLAILMSRMIPGIASIVPIYVLATNLKLIDTYWILILVYSAWMAPFALWLILGFFDTIPNELDNAAMVDGYSRLQAFYKVVVPLSKPGLAASAIVTFIFAWNEVILATVLITRDQMKTIPLLLVLTQKPMLGIDWGQLTAIATLATVPILIMFLLLQSQLIAGLTEGATKG